MLCAAPCVSYKSIAISRNIDGAELHLTLSVLYVAERTLKATASDSCHISGLRIGGGMVAMEPAIEINKNKKRSKDFTHLLLPSSPALTPSVVDTGATDEVVAGSIGSK